VPLGNGVDAAPAEAQAAGEGGDREGARRRRRRGGRGRNRGDGMGADAQGALDDGSADSAANGFDDEEQPASVEADATDLVDPPMTGTAAPALADAAPTQAPAPSQAPAPAAAAPAAPAPRAATPAPSQPIVVPQAATRAQPYALPIESLNAVASAAGLEWVHSDTDKVRAVQAAMAAEPKPAHVPRQPKPPVVLDDGPLVLVETKKDLSQIRLPFDNAAS
jgi:ribonuclease E